MTYPESSMELKTAVEVRPTQSQVFLVGCLVLAGISLFAGAGLLSIEKSSGWVLIGFAVFSFVGTLFLWKSAQPDVDLQDNHPTHIALPNGTQVSTDSRTLRSPEALRGLTHVVTEVLHRRPLPEPAGLVDESGKIVPDSKEEAVSQVAQINSDVQRETNQLLDALGISDVEPTVTQRITESDQVFP